MIHDIDIILSFVDARIENIHAAGTPVVCDQVDIASVRLEFGNGCVANITCSRISAKEQRKIRLFQKDTYVSVDFANHDVMIIRRDPQAEDCLIPGMNIEQMKISEGDALADELISFIAAVATRGTPKVTGHAARHALEIALSIMEQIENRIQKYL
jgi:predicted dehydrogenase